MQPKYQMVNIDPLIYLINQANQVSKPGNRPGEGF